MDQDGADNRFLTDGCFLVLTPRFSPDGRRVAYMAYRNGPPRISSTTSTAAARACSATSRA